MLKKVFFVLLFIFLSCSKKEIEIEKNNKKKDKINIEKVDYSFISLQKTTKINYIKLYSRVQSSSAKEVKANATGNIQLFIKEGDNVKKDQLLFTIQPEGNFKALSKYTPESGYILSLSVSNNQMVSNNKTLFLLGSAKKEIEINLNDINLKYVSKEDLKIEVRDTKEFFYAKVNKIAKVPDKNTGLFKVSLQAKSNAGVRLGSLVYIYLPSKKIEGYFIDRSYIFRLYGISYIWIILDNKIQSLKIETSGIYEDETMIEQADLEDFDLKNIEDLKILKPNSYFKIGMSIE